MKMNLEMDIEINIITQTSAADDSRRVMTYIYWSHFFLILFLKLLLNSFFNMVVTSPNLKISQKTS